MCTIDIFSQLLLSFLVWNVANLFVATSLHILEEGSPLSIIYHPGQAPPPNQLYVFTFLDLTDYISSLCDDHRQSLKSLPCSRGHNHKSWTDWSFIKAFLLLFSPPTATVVPSVPQTGTGPISNSCQIICLGQLALSQDDKNMNEWQTRVH